MTTTTSNGAQSNILLYDFYRKELWLDRFPNIEHALASNRSLLRAALASLEGITLEQFTQILDEAKAAGEDGVGAQSGSPTMPQPFAHLTELLARMYPSVSATSVPGHAPDGAAQAATFDAAFEARQLLNLYTLLHNLETFLAQDLHAIVQALSAEGSGTQASFYRIRECFRLVAQDAELIQRAILQRSRGQDDADTDSLKAHAQALQVADKLAFMALAPVQPRLPANDQLSPLTYFSQDTHIHRVPYSSNAILVGIRYDCIPPEVNRTPPATSAPAPAGNQQAAKPLPAFELMAIPHEVGHYVYHHAQLEAEAPTAQGKSQGDAAPPAPQTLPELSKQFKDNKRYGWCEEIFADVYACAIAGPLAVLGLQALLACTDEGALTKEDGEHPTPLIRPFVLSEILRVLKEEEGHYYTFQKVLGALDENWALILQRGGWLVEKHPQGAYYTIKDASSNAVTSNVADELTTLRPMIRTFVQHLRRLIPFEEWGNQPLKSLQLKIPWTTKDSDDLTEYDSEMAQLTKPAFVQQRLAHHPLNDKERCGPKDLQQLLALWGRSGPHTIGGH